jgi:putative FmdB family regulatory protein
VWAVAGPGTIEALAAVAGALALCALARSSTDVALHAFFVHARLRQSGSTRPAVCYDTGRMPIYEYHCRQCANEFELLVLKNSPTPACPECKTEDIEQLLSGFAVNSDGISQARLQAARKKLAGSKTVKDQKVAEREYFQKERAEHGGE